MSEINDLLFGKSFNRVEDECFPLNVVDFKNVNANETWIYFATKIRYTDLTQVVADGKVLIGLIGKTKVYRFISNRIVGLYPESDTFYLNFDGTNLSNKIVTR